MGSKARTIGAGQVPASTTAARALTSSAQIGADTAPVTGAAVAVGAGPGIGGEIGQGAAPGGHALAGEHGEAQRERRGTRVQGGVTQLFVAGVQPTTGNSVVILAGIRAAGSVQQPRGQARVSGTGCPPSWARGRMSQRLLDCCSR